MKKHRCYAGFGLRIKNELTPQGTANHCILQSQRFRWLNPSDPNADSTEITFDKSRNLLESEYDFVIVEIRDTMGSSVKFLEPEVETKRLDLNLISRQQKVTKPFEIIAVNSNGTIFKEKF